MTTDPAELVRGINAVFGEGTMRLGSEMGSQRHWPTGILPIDVMLNGGLPVGRFVEVYGDYSTLKSYLGYKAIGQVQQLGGRAVLVDTERSFDPDWAVMCGADPDRLPVQRPRTGEAAVAAMEMLVVEGYDLIVWDSIAATQPKQYAEKMPGEDLQPGGLARMMSAGLRRVNAQNRHTAILAINQTRVNIGMTYGGSKDTMPGGRAMPYYASHRLRMLKAGRITDEFDVWEGEKLVKSKRVIKQKIKSTLEKSKLTAPNREVWFDFDLRTGEVDEVAYMIGWAIEEGHVQALSKGWYQMDELKVHGREKFIEAVREQEEVVEWMRTELTKDFCLASPGGQEAAKSKAGSRKRKS